MRRAHGFTYLEHIESSGWGEGPDPFYGMDRPKEVVAFIYRYKRTGKITDREKKEFIPPLDYWYRW
jgi:hypothetical protein